MAVLRDAYGCDAELTCDMIAAIDWLNAGADDFRAWVAVPVVGSTNR
eukprot:COSAG03_NODE_5617_length_1208_cov_1.882777_1_plen_47_part_00